MRFLLNEMSTIVKLVIDIIIYMKQITVTDSISDAFELQHEISNNVVCATSKGSDQPVHTRRLIRAFACRLNIL